jgi:hypothetical protein
MRISGPTTARDTIIIFEEKDNLVISNLAKRYISEKLSEYFPTKAEGNKIFFAYPYTLSKKQRKIIDEVEEYIGYIMNILKRSL